MHHARLTGIIAALVALAVLAGCGSAGGPGSISPSGTLVLTPKTVNASDLRWMDIPEGLYSAAFRGSFSYGSQVSVNWNDSASTLSGTLKASKIKPNFAYQMKLVGTAPVALDASATSPGSAAPGTAAWASWQLGHNGRWWCNDDNWNVADADLAGHLASGHSVIGYLLYDFFLTDTNGNVTKPFALSSAYHVLWRTSQRARTRNDSAAVSLRVTRGSWGYGKTKPQNAGTVSVYAEWEPNRPLPGRVRLPAGTYPVTLNLTEESFHDNLGNTVPYGGFWAQVLEAAITFATN